MDIQKLQFFDNNGYNLNFDWNERQNLWEGNIYLPRVSVGLYANTTIYVLEEIDESENSDVFTNEYSFPLGPGKITFTWDRINKFVDEFFMFNFDDTYIIKETSALIYTPNDGPDCETLIINRFDEYEIPLTTSRDPRALPIHVAFMANEKYDATTYNRTLIMSYNGQMIAKIKFYAETVEEDERLKIWNSNLGYNITPEDTIIFYKSDIKEYRPDYMLLNEKRKELMMEGSNIYPYIGSYKAIINALKFFGYDNLYIIEYWRNINPNDENFGKIYHSSKYSLTKRETLRVGARNIVLPNKDYRKMNALALVYSINQPTGEVDEWELPYVKEKFTYTIEEALIKLFALRKKLNKEFMPGSSRIIDIIGEANYFGIKAITKIHDMSAIEITNRKLNILFDIGPKKYLHITDSEYYDRFINLKLNDGDVSRMEFRNLMLSDVLENNIQDNYIGDSLIKDHRDLTNKDNCDYYNEFYQRTEVDHTLYKEIWNNDDYPFIHNYDEDEPEDFRDEYTYTDSYHGDYEENNPYNRFSAKVVLTNKTFEDITFDTCELKFDCSYSEWEHTDDTDDIMAYTCENMKVTKYEGGKHIKLNAGTYSGITFDNIDTIAKPNKISWTITMSDDQIDEDLRDIGIYKEYEKKDLTDIAFKPHVNIISGVQDIDEYNQFFAELPYLGYYDVTVEIGYGEEGSSTMTNSQKRTKRKCIKVEPYNIDLIGFYYDARDLPEKLKYANDEESTMYKFIKDSIENMHGWAVSERNTLGIDTDMSMPFYTAQGEMVWTGPYFNNNIEDEWYLADNLTYEMGLLKPLVKYTRYIRSGVDVKPYTWFLIGYDYSKIAGKVKPHWSIKNVSTGVTQSLYNWDGRYFTLLLKKEGNYQITLELEDKNGNKYSVTRNIIVVSKDANYKIYQTFKKDYDFITEQALLREAMELNDVTSGDDIPSDEVRHIDVRINGKVTEHLDVWIDGSVRFEIDDVDVNIDGTVRLEQENVDVDIDGTVRFVAAEEDVIIDGTVRFEPDNVDVIIDGKVKYVPNEEDVTIDGTVRREEADVNIEGTVRREDVDVTIDGTLRYELEPGEDTVYIDIEGTIYNSTQNEDVIIDGTVRAESVDVIIDGTVSYESDEEPLTTMSLSALGRGNAVFETSEDIGKFLVMGQTANEKKLPDISVTGKVVLSNNESALSTYYNITNPIYIDNGTYIVAINKKDLYGGGDSNDGYRRIRLYISSSGLEEDAVITSTSGNYSHSSCARFGEGGYTSLYFLPTAGGSISETLYGIAPSATQIDGLQLKNYNETNSLEVYEMVSLDNVTVYPSNGGQMISSSMDISNKMSTLTVTTSQNTLTNPRIGYCGKSTNGDGIKVIIVQDGTQIRFGFRGSYNCMNTFSIDLSKHGETMTVSANTLLFHNGISSLITVTDGNGDTLTASSTTNSGFRFDKYTTSTSTFNITIN